MRTKVDSRNELRTMLRDLFVAKSAGQSHARLARAHGYVDGYMRALLDAGLATKEELLTLVQSEREQISGPAIRTIDEVSDPDGAFVAA